MYAYTTRLLRDDGVTVKEGAVDEVKASPRLSLVRQGPETAHQRLLAKEVACCLKATD